MGQRTWDSDKRLLKDLLYDLRQHHGYSLLREWTVGVLDAMLEPAKRCPHCDDGLLEMISDNTGDEVVVYDRCNNCKWEDK